MGSNVQLFYKFGKFGLNRIHAS
uniref:Uncharacterized protein n=1 Tax=Amphimedon queenslandica TaxID=400682 RepID=A0A1X7SUN5_AMPQE